MIVRATCFILAGFAVVCMPVHAVITVDSLLTEMTDLTNLTQFPDPAYTCKQFSSYDRRSTDPAVQTDENWYANGDRGQHLREEQRNGQAEWVMMEANGPGAIVRIWSADPDDAGIVRIYLDGAADPVIEMTLTELLTGKTFPFLNPVATETARGFNSYFPIPYASHCKVTASKRDFYYHIGYRTYTPGTEIKTYAPGTFDAALVQGVVAQFKDAAKHTMPEGAAEKTFTDKLAARGNAEHSLEGPGAIYGFTVKVDAKNIEEALRKCVLRIAFDDENTPSIEVPLGDFFATAPGANRYASLPSGVLEDGTLYSHWVMPYAQKAKLTLTNTSKAAITVSSTLTTAPYEWTDRSMHFHAKWHGAYPIPTRPRQDWRIADCAGKGVFVGDMLHITNPVTGWWGEGDEKIYVDGESFPSHFGTGSEDYFGYAWGSPQLFTHAYHNQIRCDGPELYGHTCVSRFHILDAIPFTTKFQFDIEVWHWAECEIAQATTAYWYAAPDATDGFEMIPVEALNITPPPPLPEPKRVEGALEGETLTLGEITGGGITIQEGANFDWSNARQAWWCQAKPGNKVTFKFPAAKASRHEVLAVFTKAADYGIARISINGEPAGEPIDFYHDGVVTTGEISLGTFALNSSENTLTIEITGANEKAIPSYMVGLDYLLLKPVE